MPVIPIHEASKQPRIKDWPNKASCDDRQIRRWFKKWPDSNVGIRTGDGLLALDLDEKPGLGRSLKKLAGRKKFPETCEALTGGGGRQLLYRTPFDIPSCTQFMGLTGIDIRSRAGLVVVEPSIHPDSGKEYVFTRHPRSGIADCPDWFLRLLEPYATDGAETAPIGSTTNLVIRPGDPEGLGADLAVRFPVPGRGCRNDQMVRCVSSLAGRGYDDETIVAAVSDWWRHFFALGLIGTNPGAAAKEIGKALAVIRQSKRHQPAVSSISHRLACREIRLSPAAETLLSAPIAQTRRLQPETIPAQDTKRVTLISDCLCFTEHERAFVGAVAVIALHKATVEPGDEVRMTHDQVREVAADRNPGMAWDSTQFERLKRKYVTRPGKAATKLELMYETEKGTKARGERVGTPSKYVLTGLRTILDVA